MESDEMKHCFNIVWITVVTLMLQFSDEGIVFFSSILDKYGNPL